MCAYSRCNVCADATEDSKAAAAAVVVVEVGEDLKLGLEAASPCVDVHVDDV